ncbi:glycosyltransferase family 2 protein [Fulvivirgaceae bacterium LMO-SS25]
MPKISLIICSYNRARFIEPALDSILAQEYEDFEVIFVENNSPDNTLEICHNFQKVHPDFPLKVFTEYNQGHSFARNRGIKEASGKIISFIDDDIILKANFLKNLADFFDQHPNLQAAGGKIIPHFEAGRPIWLSSYLEPLYACVDLGNVPKQFKGRKYPFGANMAFRAKIFDKIGLFNTDLGRKGSSLMGADEKDIFQRIKGIDEEIWYIPNVSLLHIMPADRGEVAYIKRQAIAVGQSERVRVGGSYDAILGKIGSEMIKWAGSVVLGLGFLIQMQSPKAIMLLRFRYWVLLGLLGIRKA